MNTHLGFELKFAFGYSIVGFGGVYTGKGYLLPWTYGREGRGIAVERDLVRVFLIRVLDYSTDQVHRSKKKKFRRRHGRAFGYWITNSTCY